MPHGLASSDYRLIYTQSTLLNSPFLHGMLLHHVPEHTDSESVDSGCPAGTAVHFIDEDDEDRKRRENTERKRKHHRKIRKKRRIFGSNGEVIYEVSLKLFT